MLDSAHYEGREQALVKHTFLDRYLRDQLMKVGRFGSFAYVDLFAGPWKSRAADYSDTSFGIALRRMAEAKEALAKVGVNVQFTAHLVEKDNFEELQHAVSLFDGVKAHCYRGLAEDHAPTIARAVAASKFRFVVVDPLGLPDPRQFSGLISAQNTEVLLNFMFDFANRFAGTDLMPALVDWLSIVAPKEQWQAEIASLESSAREAHITDMARGALARMGGYDYAPAITVDKVDSDRALYKLIFLSRHEKGLRLFRDAQATALQVQSDQRSRVKAAKRAEKTGQHDMFAAAGFSDPSERSAQLLLRDRAKAIEAALENIDRAPANGILWKMLWTTVLDDHVITYRDLSKAVSDWHKAGRVLIRGLPEKARAPKDDLYISRS